MFLLMFILPSLSSNNGFAESLEYVFGYFLSGGYGGIVVYQIAEPLWLQMFNHFFVYCGMLICFVFIGLFPNSVMLSWLISVSILSFLPFGSTWKRWQWLLTYPFIIFTTNGIFDKKKIKHNFVKYLVLIVIVVHSLQYVINPNSMLGVSISYDDFPDLERAYNFLSSNITDNTLLITGYLSCGYIDSLVLYDNKEAEVIRYSMLLEESNNFYVYCTSVRGLDFYVYKQKEVKINILTYDAVYAIVESLEKKQFNITKEHYTKINQFGDIEVYELCPCRVLEN